MPRTPSPRPPHVDTTHTRCAEYVQCAWRATIRSDESGIAARARRHSGSLVVLVVAVPRGLLGLPFLFVFVFVCELRVRAWESILACRLVANLLRRFVSFMTACLGVHACP